MKDHQQVINHLACYNYMPLKGQLLLAWVTADGSLHQCSHLSHLIAYGPALDCLPSTRLGAIAQQIKYVGCYGLDATTGQCQQHPCTVEGRRLNWLCLLQPSDKTLHHWSCCLCTLPSPQLTHQDPTPCSFASLGLDVPDAVALLLPWKNRALLE